MPQLVLSEDDYRIVGEGDAAAALLDSPVFLTAMERVRASCAEHILTSRPQHREAREDLYNLARGLSAVTEELLAIAALGQSTLDNAMLPSTDEADEVQETLDFYQTEY